MQSVPTEMILASAGSGKTWQLTNRYIALMGIQLRNGMPIAPERIIAITFTRKAAGEFFGEILKKLASAANDPAAISNLASDANDPLAHVLRDLSQDEYRQLLRVFIQNMPKLFLGTLDSFFANILRSFPAEYGLGGDFEVIDEHLSLVARADVYRQVFRRNRDRSGNRQSDAQSEFIEAFRRATFGKEENRVSSNLSSFIKDLHSVYLNAANEELWGNPEAIWPDGCYWLAPKIDRKAKLNELITLFEKEDSITDKQRPWWDEFRDEALEHTAGASMSNRLKGIVEKSLIVWDTLDSGEEKLTINRNKQLISPDGGALLKVIVRDLIGEEIVVKLRRTQGIFHLIDLYEQSYSHRVRRRGRLTFDDIKLLLAGHERGAFGETPLLTQLAGFEDRLRIDYRLDARYDHWLLDEFQDTSYTEWKVIENLVDEAVQDAS
ncbi:MAG: UvrD-helicase domain-containing protein, partial [Verrucomicrobiota bacterium]